MTGNLKAAVVALALSQIALFGANRKLTASDVVELIYTSLYSDHDDKRLAEELNKTQMVEQLPPFVLRYFQNLGIGPFAQAALLNLQNNSKRLREPVESPLLTQPAPSPSEEQVILQRLFQYAQSYIHGLPDFLCDEVTRRYTNVQGVMANGKPWYHTKLTHADTFTRGLQFVGGREQDHVAQSNKNKVKALSTKSGESITNGEFGGDLLIIFGTGVHPKLNWDHWEPLRGQKRAVFQYFVNAARSQFTLSYCCVPILGLWGYQQQSYNASIRGLIYIDPLTGEISRLMIQAVELPTSFPIQESNTVIDYDRVNINGFAYNLPIKAVVFGRTSDGQKNRNEKVFKHYQKFTAESVMTFNDSPAKTNSKK